MHKQKGSASGIALVMSLLGVLFLLLDSVSDTVPDVSLGLVWQIYEVK